MCHVCDNSCHVVIQALLWLCCVRRFIGSFFFWVVRLGEGFHQTFLQRVWCVSRSRHADPPTSWREHVQCAWLHSLLTEKRDEVSDIRDELEMVMRVRLIDGFVFECFSV